MGGRVAGHFLWPQKPKWVPGKLALPLAEVAPLRPLQRVSVSTRGGMGSQLNQMEECDGCGGTGGKKERWGDFH